MGLTYTWSDKDEEEDAKKVKILLHLDFRRMEPGI